MAAGEAGALPLHRLAQLPALVLGMGLALALELPTEVRVDVLDREVARDMGGEGGVGARACVPFMARAEGRGLM